MARFCTLFSSSSGNSTYIGNNSAGILIDAGKNAKQLELSLMHMNINPATIQAIFVTHEHSDHIGALRVFANRYGVNVYASRGTLGKLDDLGHLDGSFEAFIMGSGAVDIADFRICAFHTSHDSAESLGYCIETPDDRNIAVATDMGIVTPEVEKALLGKDLVLIESNHDLKMLETGPYPYYLKQRVKSDFGHLSNDDCSKTIKKLVQSGTARIVLGHLSKQNNLPRLAFETATAALNNIGATIDRDYILSVAPPNCMEKMLVF